MGIQIIATDKKGKLLGEFESETAFVKFQMESGYNVANKAPVMQVRIVTKSGYVSQKKCWVEIVKDSPLYDRNYLLWWVDEVKSGYAFPSNHGEYFIAADAQEEAHDKVAEKMNNNDPITLWIKNDKVSLDYFVAYCYSTKRPKDATVSKGSYKKVRLSEHTTPEFAILEVINLFELMDEMKEDPLMYDEEYVREIFSRYYYRSK